MSVAGRLQPLDQRQLPGQLHPQAQDRADQRSHQIVVEVLRGHQPGGNGDGRQVLRRSRRVATQRAAHNFAGFDGPDAGRQRIGFADRDQQRVVAEAIAQPVDAFAAGAGADSIDRKQCVDAPGASRGHHLIGRQPDDLNLIGPDLILREHQLQEVDIARRRAYDSDALAAEIGDARNVAFFPGDEEWEGASRDQRRIGLGRQGDVGPDDGEVGRALVDLVGALGGAFRQHESDTDRGLFTVQPLHEARRHPGILGAERPDSEPQGAWLVCQIERGRSHA